MDCRHGPAAYRIRRMSVRHSAFTGLIFCLLGGIPYAANAAAKKKTDVPVTPAAIPTKVIQTGGKKYSTFLFSPESNDPAWVFGTGMRLTIIPKRIAESETRFFPI